jgi:hypothetical protein
VGKRQTYGNLPPDARFKSPEERRRFAEDQVETLVALGLSDHHARRILRGAGPSEAVMVGRWIIDIQTKIDGGRVSASALRSNLTLFLSSDDCDDVLGNICLLGIEAPCCHPNAAYRYVRALRAYMDSEYNVTEAVQDHRMRSQSRRQPWGTYVPDRSPWL